MAIVIRGFGKALPVKKVSNNELDPALETSDEWIRSHTGIGNRYICSEGEDSVTLGIEACKNALAFSNELAKKAGRQEILPKDIDLIAVASITTRFKGFPSNSCLIQSALEVTNAAAYDVEAACSGFIYALDMVSSQMIRHNWKYALVCGTEALSTIVDWTDRATCVLFGDGAGAVLLEDVPEIDEQTRGLSTAILGADGNGWECLQASHNDFLKMDGRVVYNFAVGKMAELIKSVMEKENLSIDDVDYFVCHQANERILLAAAKRLGYPIEKFVFNIEPYGNTSSATIPITLADMQADGRLVEGKKIIIAGFGAGLTWGASLIRY